MSSHVPKVLRTGEDGGGRMLITSSRIAYRGPFGQPGLRRLGGWAFYLALDDSFRFSLGTAPASPQAFVLVPPYAPHRVTTQARELGQVLLEAESVDGAWVERLVADAAGRKTLAARFNTAFGEMGAADFDQRFFGAALPVRKLDQRIRCSIEHILEDPASRTDAAEHAALAGLSPSRFAHLFREQCQVTFRRFRAWKRARALMPLIAGQGGSLVDVALGAGYADSSHFSHAVREFYGYTPRFIFIEKPRPSVVGH